MARTPLTSRSPQRRTGRPLAVPAAVPAAPPAAAGAQAPPEAPLPRRRRWAAALQRRERWLWATAMLALALLAGWPAWTLRLQPPASFEQIDAAMRESIAKEPLASAAAAAYAAVLPSVVRVVGQMARPPAASAHAASAPRAASAPGRRAARPSTPPGGRAAEGDDDEDEGRSVGTGVVIVNTGLILTNLHVVAGADRVTVTFADGSQSEAVVVSHQPEHDLAVLQAKTIPDDLHAATLRSTQGLAPGDEVLAVGFPFGIGPSASAGIVSGLKREFRSPEGKRLLSNLIQFDAAANPGNSGGPLVTMDGHVIGIVTAIMNPTPARTFIGIGFAVPIENAASGAGLPPF
ncbi:MAG: trypsin-like peptidase domain-containing protein [Burkholderiaceae bacterium]|nr:trypsin-like peptidase domain-containing protein [Burkholderiaceae bacterium]